MNWKPTRRHLRVALPGAAAALVGVAMFWPVDPGQSLVPMAEGPAAAPTQAAKPARVQPQTVVPADTASPPLQTQPAAADDEESTIAQYVAEKYQFLLDDLRYLEASQVERLRGALLARERIAGQVDSAAKTRALESAEGQIRAMLHPADFATYEALRESDLELYKLNEYAGGVSNVAPLTAADRRAILKTKLAYKERFTQLMVDSGLRRSDLSPAEREYAYSVAARALADYQRSYLEEVRQYLASEEQFVLLRNYESTEFDDELVRLKAMANVSSQGGS